MGGCLTTTDSSSSTTFETNDPSSLHTIKKASNSNDIYSNDWLKFPICCPYCSNHSEPSSECQLVILGPGYTGKTTLRHHLVQRYGHAFCKADFLMYRDILQHNVLDLFRDLLQKPSLSFTELREFISHITKSDKDISKNMNQFEYESQVTDVISSEVDVEDQELDLGLHDLDASDTELDYKYTRKHNYLCHPTIDKQLIHSNSPSIISLDSTISRSHSYNITLNDIYCNDMINIINEKDGIKTPFSSPQIGSKSPTHSNDINALDIGTTNINVYDSDTEYKYSSVNPSTPYTPITPKNININIDENKYDKCFDVCANSKSLNTNELCGKLKGFDPNNSHILCNSQSISQINDNINKNTNEKRNNIKNKWLQFLNKNNIKNDKKKNTFSALLNAFRNSETEYTDKPTIQNSKTHSNINEIKDEIDIDDDGMSNNNNRNELIIPNREYINSYGINTISDLLHRLSTESLKYGRDNGEYLILNSDRILNDTFEPTFIDLLQCHVRSTGLMFENHVICRSLPINKYNSINKQQNKQDIVFRVVDVGGHRNERKKWSYVLQQENDVIVFVVSAASFCQVLFEDFKKNAMRESISVWEDILSNNIGNMNDSQNKYTQFILVINKIDLFYQRCHLFKEYFPEYDGNINNKHEILDYIKSLYLNIAKQYNKYSYVHCVCTKLTDSLEIASFDVEEIKNIFLNYKFKQQEEEFLCVDIVNTIIDYAIGDVFWSEKWLKPMWERKMLKNINHKINNNLNQHLCLNNELTKYQIGINNNKQHKQCDHVNNPHDYHRHRKRKRKRKYRKKKYSKSIKSITSIFQSKEK